jgi:hypothetical protein
MPSATELLVALVTLAATSTVASQEPPASLRAERAEFAAWLEQAPGSPYRALVQYPIGRGIGLGPAEAEVPLPGVLARVEPRGNGYLLTIDGATRPIGRDRLTPLGKYQLLLGGPAGRAVATVFRPDSKGHRPPSYYPDAVGWRLTVALTPATKPTVQRMLTPDGVEVEATEAGAVVVLGAGLATRLRVFRLPSPGAEESELEIYFRDGTNGRGSYPAGRFVSLIPTSDGRYLLDFNRARNPFCAYSTVYPCPAPWRGNTIPSSVEAGEQYAGGGLSKPPVQ